MRLETRHLAYNFEHFNNSSYSRGAQQVWQGMAMAIPIIFRFCLTVAFSRISNFENFEKALQCRAEYMIKEEESGGWGECLGLGVN